MVNKKKQKLEVSDVCTICSQAIEDTAHALLWCPHSRFLLSAMLGEHCLQANNRELSAEGNWFFDLLELQPELSLPTLLMTLWCNWYVRNEIVHGKPPPPIEASKRFLESYVCSLLEIKQHPQANLLKGKHVVNQLPRA